MVKAIKIKNTWHVVRKGFTDDVFIVKAYANTGFIAIQNITLSPEYIGKRFRVILEEAEPKEVENMRITPQEYDENVHDHMRDMARQYSEETQKEELEE